MQILFTDQEMNRVKHELHIDLENVIKQDVFLDDWKGDFRFSEFEERFNSIYSIIRNQLKYASHTYSSLLYYCRKVKQEIISLNQGKINHKIFNAEVVVLLCSLYNHMSFLVEKANYIGGLETILVFEACPSNLPKLDSREEARMIKKLALDNRVNPIVRFNTSISIFKKTCNDNKMDYLHFVGHGSWNGDLVFCGDNQNGKILHFPTFERFFYREYGANHSNAIIRNIFVNSCFSERFVNKIHSSSSIKILFEHSISNREEVFDSCALEFAKLFYREAFSTKSIKQGYNSAKGQMILTNNPLKKQHATQIEFI